MDWDAVFGSASDQILWWQMVLRALVVFVYGLLLIRFAGQRVFGKRSALDLIVALVAGSNLSRTLTAASPLGATLAATTALVCLHWIVARLALRFPVLEWLVKGRAEALVVGGQPQAEAMAHHGISANDLAEAMRQSGIDDQRQVLAAYIEPSGRISVIKA